MITVIADDITGAAEIAGIGLQYGLRVNLVTETTCLPECRPDEPFDMQVIATNTRSLPQAEAVDETLRLAALLKATGHRRLFKKTDSVLRGHVVAELQALMQQMDHTHALLIPENPSRQRIIKEGIYSINDVPLEQTGFRHDPEFPAHTSQVTTLLGGKVSLLSVGESLPQPGICIANATTVEEVAAFLPLLNDTVLPAGGADFFTAYLAATYHPCPQPPFEGLQNKDVLIICGSTAKHPLEEFPYIKQRGISIIGMPNEVFCNVANYPNEETERWVTSLSETYCRERSLIIRIGHTPQEGKEFAARLRELMCRVTLSLVTTHLPHELIIEGGATAYAILEAAGWKQFRVENEISPGVIRIQPVGTDLHITLKPGSYPWGESLFRTDKNQD